MSPLDRAIQALMRRVTETAILPRYRNLAPEQIVEKAEDDLVTISDREAEAMLTEGLAAIDGSIAIVGEEAAHADPAVLEGLAGNCWVIDPIDGTHNFAHGRGPFGILLSRCADGIRLPGWNPDKVELW